MSLEDRKKKDSKESSSEEKNKALNLVLGQIERNFGRGSIMRLGAVSYTHLTLATKRIV